jgi:hypothetical protein
MLLNQALNLSFKQAEVDFVIPNLQEDLNIYIDPFLFYKSGIPAHKAAHATMHRFFAIAIESIKEGNKHITKRMLAFPEVKETMLGLSTGNHSGRGFGNSRGDIIYNEIIKNKDIQQFGIKHLAEMQLLIEGVGFDMISDMCSNIIKQFLVTYTQEQCKIHSIPLENGVCLEHVFDWDELDWDDQLIDLPINPINGHPILLVPKTVVRRFEEIDYKDFWNTTYRYILRNIEIERSLRAIGKEPKITWKEINEKYNFCKKTVVDVLHEQPELMREYLEEKEKERLPLVNIDFGSIKGADTEVTNHQHLINELSQIIPGNKDAKKYEDIMVRILTLLFSPLLIDPHSQVRTIDGREIIDITYYNAANYGFWYDDIRVKHGSNIIVIELKNMKDLSNEEYFQIAARLNDDIGKFGILIARDMDGLDSQRAYRRFNREKKVIITLTDKDIIEMLTAYGQGLNATMYLMRKYRKFMEEA